MLGPEMTAIPFGKYKGLALPEVQARDPDYVRWLREQPWFAEKFRSLFDLARVGAAALGEAQDSPEHNAMQARFLSVGYCTAFVAALDLECLSVGGAAKAARRYYADKLEDLRSEVRFERLGSRGRLEAPRLRAPTKAELVRSGCRTEDEYVARFGQRWYSGFSSEWRAKNVRAYLAYRAARSAAPPAWTCDVQPARFEGDSDAEIVVLHGCGSRSALSVLVELKPSIGDDYPAVLRQIKAQRDRRRAAGRAGIDVWACLAGALAPSSVLPSDVVATFAREGIRLLLAADVADSATIRPLPGEWA